jgi:hypothetical protein
MEEFVQLRHRQKKKKAMRTKTVEENEEILIGSVIAWRIAERRRDG